MRGRASWPRAGAERHCSADEEDEGAHFGWTGLPNALDWVLIEGGVTGDDGQVFNLRLRDDKPVEWVSVVEGEVMDALEMGNVYAQELESVCSQLAVYEIRKWLMQYESSAKIRFYRQFRNACKTQIHRHVRV